MKVLRKVSVRERGGTRRTTLVLRRMTESQVNGQRRKRNEAVRPTLTITRGTVTVPPRAKQLMKKEGRSAVKKILNLKK